MSQAAVGERRARERLLRVLYLAAGIGATIFGGLLLRGDGGIIAQHDQLWTPFAWVTVMIAVVIPASFALLAYLLPLRVLRAIGGSVALGFVACQLLWVPFMTNDVLAFDRSPWLQGVTALHATIAAIVWQHRAVWLYPILQAPIITIVQLYARDDSTREAILDGLGGLLFCLILMGVAIAVVSAADRQDAAAERARGRAALESVRRTREREQGRINAMVHDDIMSVLLAASRESPPESLASQATVALASIKELIAGDIDERTYAPEEVVAVVRSTVSELAPGVEFDFDLDGELPVSAPVVAAVTEAVGEAMRNSLLHAARGDEQITRHVSVAVTDKGISVVARDDGAGFSLRGVSERRLGIRVSIVERMRSLEGGSASVTSRPGRGTVVTLTWERP